MSSPKEVNEAVRLTELYQLDILDTNNEEYFEALVDLGISAFNSAFCFIAFVDSTRQWFKAKRGFDIKEIPRDLSICAQTIRQNVPNVINNCLEHPELKNNSLVTGDPHVRAYLGVPIQSLSGNNIGTFCILDNAPRPWSKAEISIASALSKLVEHNLVERAIKVKESGEVNSTPTQMHTNHQGLGSWKSVSMSGQIELSPSMEKWLCLSQSRRVQAKWFHDLPVAEDRDAVNKARLERTGNPFTYRVRLPNGDMIRLEEQVYGNGNPNDQHLFGLVKKIGEAATTTIETDSLSEEKDAPRMDSQVDLKRFPKSFLRETVQGKLSLDHHGFITGLANTGEPDLTKIKQKENFIDLLYKEDQETFRKTLAQSLENQVPSEAWVRLNVHDDRTWLRMELNPKKRFTAFNKPTVDATFTALINKSSSAQKSIFDENLLNLTGTLGKVGGWYYHLESGALKITDMLREVLGVNKDSLHSVFHLSSILSRLSGRNIAVLFIECINNRKPASLEFEAVQSDEKKKWFRVMIRPSIGEDGVPMGLYGSIADISETKRIEQALEKNLLTYNLIVDNLTDGLIEIDPNLNVSFVNRNAKTLLQKERELFVHAMPLEELIPDLDKVLFAALLESVNKVGVSKSVEQFVGFIKRWISLRVFKSGSGYTILIKDVTKRKNQSSDLYMLNSAIEQIREIIIVTNDIRKTKDPFGLLYVNSAFEAFVGQSRDKWLGRNPYHLIHGRIPTRHYRQLLVAFLSRQKVLVKTEYEVSPEHKVTCDILISPFLDTARNAPCFLIVFRVFDN